jgi:translation initiation factor RLI1
VYSAAYKPFCSFCRYVIVVEHDISILDYLSDYICCLYGSPGAYGVVTLPSSVREGINIFLNGFIPTENLRFREEKLTFKVSDNIMIKHFWSQIFILHVLDLLRLLGLLLQRS